MKTTPQNNQNNNEPMSRDERRRVISMKKVKQRRRRKIISYAVLVSLVIVVGIVLSLTVFFHIGKIEILNSTIYNDSDIVAASGIKLNDNMFLTNMKKASENVETKLPYILDVKVKRHLSGKVTLTITETAAEMGFLDNGSYILINPTGKVLENSELLPSTAALVDGAQVESGEVGHQIKLRDLLAADGTSVLSAGAKQLENLITANNASDTYLSGDISEIDISDINNLKIVYQYRIMLKCGDITKIDQTLKFAKAIIEKLDAENSSYVGTVDLTIENKAYYNEGELETTTEPVTQTTTAAVTEGTSLSTQETTTEKVTLGTAD